MTMEERHRSRSPTSVEDKKPASNGYSTMHRNSGGFGGGAGFRSENGFRRGKGGYQGPRTPLQGFTNRFEDNIVRERTSGYGYANDGPHDIGVRDREFRGRIDPRDADPYDMGPRQSNRMPYEYREDSRIGGGRNIRFGDWWCNDCNCSNFAKNTECFKCKIEKPVDSPSSLSKVGGQEERANYPRQEREIRPGDWECTDCKVSVFGSRDSCFKCGKPKPENPILSSSLHNWECSECFASNHHKRYDCFKCQRPKPANAKEAEKLQDWMCVCGRMNAARRTNCSACDAARPGREKELEANPDWKCPNCNINNWSWRTSCYKCNTAKPNPSENEHTAKTDEEL